MNQPAHPAAAADGQTDNLSAEASTSKESYRSDELFGDRKEILILHNAEVYRLRRTRQDKLILCK